MVNKLGGVKNIIKFAFANSAEQSNAMSSSPSLIKIS